MSIRQHSEAQPATRVHPEPPPVCLGIKRADGVLLPLDVAADVAKALKVLAMMMRERGALLHARFDEIAEILTRETTRDASPKMTTAPTPAHPDIKLVDINSAAQQLGIREDSVRDQARRGTLPAIKRGPRWYVSQDAINARVATNRKDVR